MAFDEVQLRKAFEILLANSVKFGPSTCKVQVTALKPSEERVALLQKVTADIPNVEVDASPMLLAEYAKLKNASCVVKGLRALSDFEKEFQMAMINRKLNPGLETMFLSARQNYTYLSSSITKELAMYHVPLTDFVPDEIAEEVQARMEDQLGR